jgi:hypothetical protein
MSGQTTVISVRKNAPNWPAMVEKKKIKIHPKQTEMQVEKLPQLVPPKNPIVPSAEEEQRRNKLLDLAKRTRAFCGNNQFPSVGRNTFAQKPISQSQSQSLLVRQCLKCQILYTHFHQCLGSSSSLSSLSVNSKGNVESNSVDINAAADNLLIDR